jgi:hypothetical protein
MILTLGTLTDPDPAMGAAGVPAMPQADAGGSNCDRGVQAGADPLCVSRVLVHVRRWSGADSGRMVNVPGVRIADGWWAVLLALPIVLATALGTSTVDRSVAGPLWVTALLTVAACHGLRLRRGPVP